LKFNAASAFSKVEHQIAPDSDTVAHFERYKRSTCPNWFLVVAVCKNRSYLVRLNKITLFAHVVLPTKSNVQSSITRLPTRLPNTGNPEMRPITPLQPVLCCQIMDFLRKQKDFKLTVDPLKDCIPDLNVGAVHTVGVVGITGNVDSLTRHV
jgi:hypothetical protein